MKINVLCSLRATILAALLIAGLTGCGMLNASASNAGGKAETLPEVSSGPETSGAAEAPAGDPGRVNLLSLSTGAFVVRSTSKIDPLGTFLLIDDHEGAYGSLISEEGETSAEYVIALPDKVALDSLELCGTNAPNDAESAKDVVVQVSDTSADVGFETIFDGSMTNEPIAKAQAFKVAKKIPGRWVKVIVKNTHGGKQIGLSEIKGFGDRLAAKPIGNVTGAYTAPMYYGSEGESKIYLKQTGTTVEGCVVSTNSADNSRRVVQLISNGAMANAALLTFTQNILDSDNSISKGNPAIIVFSPDGQKFYSRIVDDIANAEDFYAQSSVLGTKVGNETYNCPQWTAKTSSISDELKSTGRVRFYGINFDTNSDVIKPESFAVLDKIVQTIKANPDWHFVIEGHTDSVADDAYNKKLSERRALSVKAYLIKAGVPADRVETAGYGETMPIADNASEAGRAQNRRVELVKK